MRVAFLLITLSATTMVALSIDAPAVAQVRDFAVIVGDQGEQKVLSLGIFNRQTCQSLASNLQLQSRDSRAEVRIAEIEGKFGTDQPVCAGKPLNQTAIFLKPAAGQRGFQRYRFLEMGGPRGPTERELIVFVRDPARTNTALPTKDDVEHIFGPVKPWSLYAKELDAQKPASTPQSSAPAPILAGREGEAAAFMIPRNAQGFFGVKATIGGLEADAIIDTGANYVVIPYAIGEKLGLLDQPGAKKITAQTAGGMVESTLVKLSALGVGPFLERDVEAAVLPKGLDAPILIGAPFLKRVKRISITGDMLLMMPK